MTEQTKKPLTCTRRTFLGGASILAGLAGAMSLSGCGSRSDASQTLNYYIGNPTAIDPYNCSESNGNVVARQLFDPLFTYDFTAGELVPCAAESYTADATGTQFTFVIKQGNTFHNGEPVNAQSVKRGWERLCNPNTGGSPSVVAYYLQNIKGYDDVMNGAADELVGVTCPDEYTVQVELSSAFMDFPMITTIMCTAPMPQAALDDFESFWLAPIGNGPYQMNGKWEDGQYIDVTAYPDYVNGEAPKIQNIHFNIQKDTETAFREFQAGNLDICDIPATMFRDTADTYGVAVDGYTIEPGHQVFNGPEPAIYFLTLNMDDPTLKDVNLRRALSLAINRENIAETVMEGTRVAADNLVAPTVEGYQEGGWPYARYDKDAALEILDRYYPADSNGDRGVSVTLTYNVDGSHKQVMEAIQGDWQAIGINVIQDTKEWAAVLSAYKGHGYQIGRTGWTAEYPSIDDFVYTLCYTGNTDNTAYYSNSQVDSLLRKARATQDEAARISVYQQANALVAQDVPYIPIMFYRGSKVGSDRIQKAYIAPIEIESAAQWELVQ